MRKPKRYGNHECCPEEWRGISDLTGSYEMDGLVARTTNRDAIARLEDHLVSDVAYELSNGYRRSSIG